MPYISLYNVTRVEYIESVVGTDIEHYGSEADQLYFYHSML